MLSSVAPAVAVVVLSTEVGIIVSSSIFIEYKWLNTNLLSSFYHSQCLFFMAYLSTGEWLNGEFVMWLEVKIYLEMENVLEHLL